MNDKPKYMTASDIMRRRADASGVSAAEAEMIAPIVDKCFEVMEGATGFSPGQRVRDKTGDEPKP